MYTCPICQRKCIPIWRALAMTRLRPAFHCPCCGGLIERDARPLELLAGLPLLLAQVAIYQMETPDRSTIFLFILAALGAGLGIWLLLLVRYKDA